MEFKICYLKTIFCFYFFEVISNNLKVFEIKKININTPLHIDIKKENIEIIKLLLNRKDIDLEKVDHIIYIIYRITLLTILLMIFSAIYFM